MNEFLTQWGEAALTSTGFFWSALWAFALGYLVSSIIQVFVTHQRMKKAMGEESAKTIGLGTFFGFISSSCSFAALATTKSLFKKGAGFMPSMAFLLASTNLVIELGIVIGIFLSWQYVVGEYIGGILLILFSWLFVKLTKPAKLIKKIRKKLSDEEEEHGKEESDSKNWKEKFKDSSQWKKVSQQYWAEWKMVWKDVTVGFTLAGIIAVFVPKSFFETLFIGTGSGENLSFLQVLQHTIIGPIAAFMTFIGSMGNIPLASVLFGSGVSFAGVMAFIFSDLVVFPVLRINAKYYGWKMSLYICLMLLVALVCTSMLLHYGFELFQILPQAQSGGSAAEKSHFKINYGFFLNIAFVVISAVMAWFAWKKSKENHQHHGHSMAKTKVLDKILKVLAFVSYGWLAIGLFLSFLK